MERYVCVHGHFYQPPRENAWLEVVELQDSAHPYHDWNERVTAECYAPNSAARLLDAEGLIVGIASNYARMSFNFGPTLLAWLERRAPATYRAILAADRESAARFSGHGSALAQAYSHVILPLANRRDKATQVVWGIDDFARRFGRRPEGMWLPETAVDLETLEVLAEQGIRFTILAPHQARRVRPPEEGKWLDVAGGRIDPTMPYRQRLPSGRTIVLFFYDGPLARAVAFERLLSNGGSFAGRLVDGFDDARRHAELVHIATDGESYGHHHHHGDMALAYALEAIESSDRARLTNYGEYLATHPPTHEVEIAENTSWSCSHGIERWRGDCGCNSGGHPGWNQSWRTPLRDALDWLRDALASFYEDRAGALLRDPWRARDEYHAVVVDRSPGAVADFFARHAARELDADAQVAALKLLEVQRQALVMYTSCAWFFDELSGLETVQVLQCAGRAVDLARSVSVEGEQIEAAFLARLERAKSNLPEHGDGRRIYETWIRPARVDLEKATAHDAITSLLDEGPDRLAPDAFRIQREDFRRLEVGPARVVVGRTRAASTITGESAVHAVGLIHFGDHDVSAGVRPLDDPSAYAALVRDLGEAAERGDVAGSVRLLDRFFGEMGYSVHSLFRDGQRAFLRRVLTAALGEDEATYRQLSERRTPLMRLLTSLGAPLPAAFRTALALVVNADLARALTGGAPDAGEVRALLERARTWQVDLDARDLAHAVKQAMEAAAARVRARPSDAALVGALRATVEAARALPFEVDLWTTQNAYYDVLRTTYVGMRERVEEGEEEARAWVDGFVALGERLGFRVDAMPPLRHAPTVAAVVDEVLAQRRVPRACYRLQFNPGFTFRDALALVPYLDDLGISEIYASPLLRPRPGSPHGYDVCDPGQLNPALGSEEDFGALIGALQARGMGLLLDTVPNHMGIGDEANAWWMDVLENGPSSPFASYFDIDWRPVKTELANKVLLPILDDQYGRVLEDGKLCLAYDDGAFTICYGATRFPVSPGSYDQILGHVVRVVTDLLGADHEHVRELESIMTAVSYLPPRTERDPDKRIERNREKVVIKGRIAALGRASADVRAAIGRAVADFNGRVGEPVSFDLLDQLMDAQAYRLAYWRVAAEEINYRRFFDVNDLAAIRTEDPEVFDATHRLVFRLLATGAVTGLRIDHIDGLNDPAAYLRRLQEGYVFHRVREDLARTRETPPDDALLARRVSARFAAWWAEQADRSPAGARTWPLYVVAEKILGDQEVLPHHWAVAGTTGYDFLNAVNGLMVDGRKKRTFDAIYREFTGSAPDLRNLVNASKKRTMLVSMAGEVYALAYQLERVAERNRRYRDFTLDTLTFAIREIIASLPVYRAYVGGADDVTVRDRAYVEAAVAEAKRRNRGTAEELFDFVGDTLLLRTLRDFESRDQGWLLDWVHKFQQLTGPVMAKGVEDTAFYIYNRLISLNEVGGNPDRFGCSVARWHEHNRKTRSTWPHTLLTTSTHDTKRGEDTRLRIDALSELPDEWRAAVARWAALNATHKTEVDGQPVPDRNDEYLLYQTLVGAWPLECPGADGAPAGAPATWTEFRARIQGYMEKATREAKVHTSWVEPNRAHDAAVRTFVGRLLDETTDNPFLGDIRAFAGRVAAFARWSSLSQVLLKLTAPGVPDVYQGDEVWCVSLVDPDNRRPVDFARLRAGLAELKRRVEEDEADLRGLVEELLATSADGRIKMYVTWRALAFRRRHADLFATGTYRPLEASGEQAEHVCAFARSAGEEVALVVAPRLLAALAGGAERPPTGGPSWGGTWLGGAPEWAGGRFRNWLTGEVLRATEREGRAVLPLAEVCATCPVALLEWLPPPIQAQ